MKKKENVKTQKVMTLWARCKKTFTYHFAFCVFFNIVFWNLYSVKDLFITMDVITYPTILFDRLPWALGCVLLFVLSWVSLDKFLGVLINIYRLKKQDTIFTDMGSSIGVDGVQGIGKTRLLMYVAMVMQYPKFYNLRYNYYIDCPIENNLKEDFDGGNTWKYIRFKARKESVCEYLKNDDKLPLVYSNMQLTVGTLTPRNLSVGHFAMRERLYESNIKLASELDNLLPNTMKKKDKLTSEEAVNAKLVDEFSGLDRQYCDGTLLADTHRNGALYIPIRDCQQMKLHLTRRKNMYAPSLLSFIFSFLKDKIVKDSKEKTTLKQRKRCKWFEATTRSIGFTKIYYYLESGPAGATKLDKNNELFFILPNEVPYAYDDRGLQSDYIPLGYRDMPKVEEKEEKTPKKNNNVA